MCSMFCYVLLCVLSSFAIILMGRQSWLLVCLSSWCLQCVIVAFPDHTHMFVLELPL